MSVSHVRARNTKQAGSCRIFTVPRFGVLCPPHRQDPHRALAAESLTLPLAHNTKDTAVEIPQLHLYLRMPQPPPPEAEPPAFRLVPHPPRPSLLLRVWASWRRDTAH